MLIQKFDARIVRCQYWHTCKARQVGRGRPLTLLAARGQAPVTERRCLDVVLHLKFG